MFNTYIFFINSNIFEKQYKFSTERFNSDEFEKLSLIQNVSDENKKDQLLINILSLSIKDGNKINLKNFAQKF